MWITTTTTTTTATEIFITHQSIERQTRSIDE